MELRRIIEREHPSLHVYHNKYTFGRYADSTFASIETELTAVDFYVLLSRLVEKVNCGHTYLSLPKGYWESANSTVPYFPFKLYFQNGRAVILHNYSQDTTLISGSEILSVNGTSMTSIVNTFLDVISSDGFNETYKYAKMNRLQYGIFPGYPEYRDSYDVTYTIPNDFTEWTTTVKGITLEELEKIKNKSFIQREHYPQYSFEMIDSLSTAIVTIRDFVPDDPDDYSDFLEHAFESIHQNKIQNVVIDLRDNDGGDPAHAADLLSYVTDSPYVYFHDYVIGYGSLKRPRKPHPLNFRGNRYILVDGGCFSTTGHLLSLIKYHGFGILIGEETGGSFLCYGCPKEYILPNTKIRLQCMRCTYSANVEGFPRGRGIKPEIEVKPRIEDIVEGKDTIREYVLSVIGNAMDNHRRRSFLIGGAE